MNTVDKTKIDFIICSNNARELDECIYYLEQLEVPEGMETKLIVIDDALSMASGYNRGMQLSDAKYKVYMHHDMMILNRFFIRDILQIFQKHNEVGVLGIMGTDKHVANGSYFDSWNRGFTYTDACPFWHGHLDSEQGNVHKVVAVDGMLMVTQYDIPWREDLFYEWDMYDISQCFEFIRQGYEVAVPYQKESWCWHDTETSKLKNYNRNAKILKREYQDIYPFLEEKAYIFDFQLDTTLNEFDALILGLMQKDERESVSKIIRKYFSALGSNLNLIHMGNISLIDEAERKATISNLFWKKGMQIDELVARLWEMKFAVKRAEFLSDAECINQLVKQDKYSTTAWITVIIIYVRERNKVKRFLTEVYTKNRRTKEVDFLKKIEVRDEEYSN